MAISRKSIKIGYAAAGSSYEDSPEIWQVITVKNSTNYVPKEILKKSDVEALCASPAWEVVIVPLLEEKQS